MAGCVATCIFSRKSFKPSMDPYHRHAPCLQNLVPLKKCSKLDHVQWGCTRMGMTMVGNHARLNNFRHRMQVATCSTILSVLFYKGDSRKCRICWKPNQLGMVPWIACKRPWKKSDPFLHLFGGEIGAISNMLKNNVLLDEPFWPYRIISIVHGVFWTSLKWPQLINTKG